MTRAVVALSADEVNAGYSGQPVLREASVSLLPSLVTVIAPA